MARSVPCDDLRFRGFVSQPMQERQHSGCKFRN